MPIIGVLSAYVIIMSLYLFWLSKAVSESMFRKSRLVLYVAVAGLFVAGIVGGGASVKSGAYLGLAVAVLAVVSESVKIIRAKTSPRPPKPSDESEQSDQHPNPK